MRSDLLIIQYKLGLLINISIMKSFWASSVNEELIYDTWYVFKDLVLRPFNHNQRLRACKRLALRFILDLRSRRLKKCSDSDLFFDSWGQFSSVSCDLCVQFEQPVMLKAKDLSVALLPFTDIIIILQLCCFCYLLFIRCFSHDDFLTSM